MTHRTKVAHNLLLFPISGVFVTFMVILPCAFLGGKTYVLVTSHPVLKTQSSLTQLGFFCCDGGVTLFF